MDSNKMTEEQESQTLMSQYKKYSKNPMMLFGIRSPLSYRNGTTMILPNQKHHCNGHLSEVEDKDEDENANNVSSFEANLKQKCQERKIRLLEQQNQILLNDVEQLKQVVSRPYQCKQLEEYTRHLGRKLEHIFNRYEKEMTKKGKDRHNRRSSSKMHEKDFRTMSPLLSTHLTEKRSKRVTFEDSDDESEFSFSHLPAPHFVDGFEIESRENPSTRNVFEKGE